jgi:hypothetical protein
MNFTKHNLDPNTVLSVSGPHVPFKIRDTGQGAVALTLRMSEGTVIHFPNQQGNELLTSVLMPQGRYDVVVVASIVPMPGLGRNYNTVVTIGGTKVLSARGTLAAGAHSANGLASFVLDVL